MPVTRELPPLPAPDVPLVDPETGLITPPWYRFFLALMAVLAEMRGLIP